MNFFKKKDAKSIPPASTHATARTPGNLSASNRGSPNTYLHSTDDSVHDTSPKFDSNNYKVFNHANRADGTSGEYTRYTRPGHNLNTARGELFLGYAPGSPVTSGRLYDRSPSGSTSSVAEGMEGDFEAIKRQTRWTKQESVHSARNALRIAREAEETARSTLGRLGDQSEKLANTERHLDLSKVHTQRADDKADELRQLNRSIFRPVITWNKDAKRAAQEAEVRARYEEDREERGRTVDRVGRMQAYNDDEEILGERRRDCSRGASAGRMEQRRRYRVDATAYDDEIEDELDDNLTEIGKATKRLKEMGMAMGNELDSQIGRMKRIEDKTVDVDRRLDTITNGLKRIK